MAAKWRSCDIWSRSQQNPSKLDTKKCLRQNVKCNKHEKQLKIKKKKRYYYYSWPPPDLAVFQHPLLLSIIH
jgi:hypothetical protein